MAITRFQIVDYFVSKSGGYGSYHVIMRGYLETYHRKSSHDPEERYCTNEIAVTGNGASESAALADAQFRFQQMRNNYEQERYSMYNSPSSSVSRASGSGNDGAFTGIVIAVIGYLILFAFLSGIFSFLSAVFSPSPSNVPNYNSRPPVEKKCGKQGYMGKC